MRVFSLIMIPLLLANGPGFSRAEEPLWPIDAPRKITSTFGEPRAGRYHLGVDFSSGGVTGKAVYALGDGWISYVATSPFGYGKVLEYTLDDGAVVRCGHLSGFLPAVEDRLDSLRAGAHSYDVRYSPPRGMFRLIKGDVVAYSGDTGAGPPHLHLEYRDRTGAIINPFLRGIAAPDTVAPEIGDILFVPLDRDAAVDGSPFPTRYDPTRNDPPHLTGRVGVAASLVDRNEPDGFNLGVYRAALTLDGVEMCSKEYGTIPPDGGRIGGLDYLAGWRYGGEGPFSAFFRREGNGLDFFKGAGLPAVTPGSAPAERMLRITAGDFTGNTTARDAAAVFGARPVITSCAFDSTGVLKVSGTYSGELDRVELLALRNGGWVPLRTVKVKGRSCTVTETAGDVSETVRTYIVGRDGFRSVPAAVRFDGRATGNGLARCTVGVTLFHDRAAVRIATDHVPGSLPALYAVRADGKRTAVPVTPLGDTLWAASAPLDMGRNVIRLEARALDSRLRPITGAAGIETMRIAAGSDFTVYAPDSRFSVRALPGTLYRDAPVTVACVDSSPPERLVPVSSWYRVEWGDEPFRGACRVTFRLDRRPTFHDLVYVSNGGREWRCLGGIRRGSDITVDYLGSGLLGVFGEYTPPEVMPLAPAEGGKVTGRPVIRFRVQDRESGIGGSNAIVMLLDGVTVYGEYDPENDTVSYTPGRDLPPGGHTADVHVSDRAGNRSFAKLKFTVR